MSRQEDIRILRCPLTQQSLFAIGQEKLDEINFAIRSGTLSHVSGDPVEGGIEAGLVNEQQTLAYRCREGVFVLLPSLAIGLSGAVHASDSTLRGEKQLVQRFYQEIGWKSSAEGKYADTEIFVDQRPVSREYMSRCHLRLNDYLPKSGQYFLDAASGAIPHDEYLTYSANFEKRICVDLSYQALQEAQRKLGDKGIYILGDVVHLPLQDDLVDAAVSLHTIYHVPADEQRAAFDELHRVLKPSARALVVYTFGRKVVIVRAASAPIKALSIVKKAATKFWRRISHSHPGRLDTPEPSEAQRKEGGLYYHPHSYAWFKKQQWDYPLDIYCWRSIGKQTLQQWIHARLLGQQLLRALFFLEGRLPKIMGRWGQYPLIVIHKQARRSAATTPFEPIAGKSTGRQGVD